uniref:conjugal transfer protein TraD n=1 Tax=Acinetobacter sp. YH16055 TaxID=2601193 RepID=UPI00211E000F
NKKKAAVRKLLNAEKKAERKARTRQHIQLGALFEIAKLDQRDPAELLGVLIKTAEIDPNDMKWQIWKDLGQEMLNKRSNENKKSGGVSKSMLTLNEAIIDVKKG